MAISWSTYWKLSYDGGFQFCRFADLMDTLDQLLPVHKHVHVTSTATGVTYEHSI